MDEIFHVPQAQAYFKGNYLQWDPMITTPPGLYAISVILLKCFRLQDSVFNLRAINLVFALGILVTSRSICRQSATCGDCWRAFLVALLPNLFIFYGLFYTDAGSVFFVLLAHFAMLKKWRISFFAFALLSLTFRQTNIIWTALFSISDGICREIQGDLKLLCMQRSKLSKDLFLMISLLGIFSFFVFFMNGGSIALGDKGSHSVSLHFAQFFYCTTTIFIFCFPLLIPNQWKKPSRAVICFFAVSLLVAFLAVRHGTIVHPYVLADNRHWINFIWRRFLCKEAIRFALVPLHALSITLIYENLMETRGFLWAFGYFCTCAIVLIPSPLPEPRYYIFPLVFFTLNCKIPSKGRLIIQMALFTIINSFIIGMFLYKPFLWSNGELQRRIW